LTGEKKLFFPKPILVFLFLNEYKKQEKKLFFLFFLPSETKKNMSRGGGGNGRMSMHIKEQMIKETPAFHDPAVVCFEEQTMHDHVTFIVPGYHLSLTSAFPTWDNPENTQAKVLHYLVEFLNDMLYRFPNGSPLPNTKSNQELCGEMRMVIEMTDYEIPPRSINNVINVIDDIASEAGSEAGEEPAAVEEKPKGRRKAPPKVICGYLYDELDKHAADNATDESGSALIKKQKVWVAFEYIFKKIPDENDELYDSFDSSNVAAIRVTLFTEDINYKFFLAMKLLVASNNMDFNRGLNASQQLMRNVRLSSISSKSKNSMTMASMVANPGQNGGGLGSETESQRLAFKNITLFTKNWVIEYLAILGLDPLDIFQDEVADLEKTSKQNPFLADVLYAYHRKAKPHKVLKYKPKNITNSVGLLSHYSLVKIFQDEVFIKKALKKLKADDKYQSPLSIDIHETLRGTPTNVYRPVFPVAAYMTEGTSFLRTRYYPSTIMTETSGTSVPLVRDIREFQSRDLMASMDTGQKDIDRYINGIPAQSFQPFERLAMENESSVSTCCADFGRATTYAQLCYAATKYANLLSNLTKRFMPVVMDSPTCENLRQSTRYINSHMKKGNKSKMLRLMPEFSDLLPVSQWIAWLGFCLNAFTTASDTNHFIYDDLMMLYHLFLNSRNLRKGGIGLHKILNGGPGTGKSFAEFFMEQVALPGSILKIDAMSSRAVQSMVGDFMVIMFPDAGAYFAMGPDKNKAVDPNDSQARAGIQALMSEACLNVSRAEVSQASGSVTTRSNTILFRANVLMNTNYVTARRDHESDPFQSRMLHITTALNNYSDFSRKTKKSSQSLSEADKTNMALLVGDLKSYQALTNVFCALNLEFGLSVRPSRAQTEAFFDRLLVNGKMSLTTRQKEMQLHTGDTLCILGAIKQVFTSKMSPFNWETYETDEGGEISVNYLHSSFSLGHLVYLEPFMAVNTGSVQAAVGGFAMDYSTGLHIGTMLGNMCGFNANNIRSWVHAADSIKKILNHHARKLPSLENQLKQKDGINEFLSVYCATREKPLTAEAGVLAKVAPLAGTDFIVPLVQYEHGNTGAWRNNKVVKEILSVAFELDNEIGVIARKFIKSKTNNNDGISSAQDTDGNTSAPEPSVLQQTRQRQKIKPIISTPSAISWNEGIVSRVKKLDKLYKETKIDANAVFWSDKRNSSEYTINLGLMTHIINAPPTAESVQRFKDALLIFRKLFKKLLTDVESRTPVKIGDSEYMLNGGIVKPEEAAPARLPNNYSRNPKKRLSEKYRRSPDKRPKDFISPYLDNKMAAPESPSPFVSAAESALSNKRRRISALRENALKSKFAAKGKGRARNQETDSEPESPQDFICDENGSSIHDSENEEEEEEEASPPPEEPKTPQQAKDDLDKILTHSFPYGAPWTGYPAKVFFSENPAIPSFTGKNAGNDLVKMQFHTFEGMADPNYIVLTSEKLEEMIIEKITQSQPQSSPLLPMEVKNVIEFGTKNCLFGPMLPMLEETEMTPYKMGCLFHPSHLMQCKSCWLPIFKRTRGKEITNTTSSEASQQEEQPQPTTNQDTRFGGGGNSNGNNDSKSKTQVLWVSTLFLMHNQTDILRYIMKQMASQVNPGHRHVIPVPSLQNLSFFVDVKMPQGMPAETVQNMKYITPEVQRIFNEVNSEFVFDEEHSMRVLDTAVRTGNESQILANKAFKQMGYPSDSITEDDILYVNATFTEWEGKLNKGTLKHPESLIGCMESSIKINYG
jgi:hypothetical protein